MDPWSSPWNDQPKSTTHELKEDALHATAAVSADPWATSDASPTKLRPDLGIKRMPSALFAADAWGSEPAPPIPTVPSPEEHKLDLGVAADPWGAAGVADRVEEPPTPAWEPEPRGWQDDTFAGKDEPDFAATSTYVPEPASAWGDAVDAPESPTAEARPKQEEDVWASEASQRVAKGKQLSTDELDELKVAARKLMLEASDVNPSAAFRIETGGEEGWSSLYGEHGSRADLLKKVSSSPPAIFKEDGSIIANLFEHSHNTAHLTREAIRKTEGRGSKLLAPETGGVWKRQSRLVTKKEWDFDTALKPDALEGQTPTRQSLEVDAGPSAGPGWAQTTAKETRTAIGGGLFASLWKSRQASSSSPKPSSSGSASPTARNSMDQSARASMETPPPAPMPTYRDDAASAYTDDPTGPDLMSMGSEPQPAPVAPAPAQGGPLLSRWHKGGGLFGSAAPKRRPGFDENDIAWLDNHTTSTAADSSYDVDDSFDEFIDQPAGRGGHARSGSLIDFGGAQQTSFYDKPVPSSNPRKEKEDDWGSWDWDEPKTAVASRVVKPMSNKAGLSRTPSLQVQPASSRPATSAIKSPLSGGPLLPPPPSSNRFSLPPPPRSSGVQSPTSPPPEPLLGDAAPPTKLSAGTNLTASDLSFFDSL